MNAKTTWGVCRFGRTVCFMTFVKNLGLPYAEVVTESNLFQKIRFKWDEHDQKRQQMIDESLLNSDLFFDTMQNPMQITWRQPIVLRWKNSNEYRDGRGHRDVRFREYLEMMMGNFTFRLNICKNGSLRWLENSGIFYDLFVNARKIEIFYRWRFKDEMDNGFKSFPKVQAEFLYVAWCDFFHHVTEDKFPKLRSVSIEPDFGIYYFSLAELEQKERNFDIAWGWPLVKELVLRYPAPVCYLKSDLTDISKIEKSEVGVWKKNVSS